MDAVDDARQVLAVVEVGRFGQEDGRQAEFEHDAQPVVDVVRVPERQSGSAESLLHSVQKPFVIIPRPFY